jgi:hypothetical protein
VSSYTREQVEEGLEQYEPSVEGGNKFFSVDLTEGESAWNPEGDTYDGPGSVTYALYGKSRALCATFSPIDSI